MQLHMHMNSEMMTVGDFLDVEFEFEFNLIDDKLVPSESDVFNENNHFSITQSQAIGKRVIRHESYRDNLFQKICLQNIINQLLTIKYSENFVSSKKFIQLPYCLCHEIVKFVGLETDPQHWILMECENYN